jgi:CBS domain-containing protein
MQDRLLLYVIEDSARLIDAAQAIIRNQSRCGIVTSSGRVVGVISEGDILRALLKGADVHSSIDSWTNRGFRFLSSKDYNAAYRIMAHGGVTLLPVLDNDFNLIDVISVKEMLDWLRMPDGAKT